MYDHIEGPAEFQPKETVEVLELKVVLRLSLRPCLRLCRPAGGSWRSAPDDNGSHPD